MPLPTDKTKRVERPENQSWLIYGEPKVGKTPLALGFKDPLFLITDAKQPYTAFTVMIDTWEKFTSTVQEILTTKHTYGTVVIDVIDGLYKLCTSFCNTRLNIAHVSDAKFAKGYNSIDNEFDHWLNKLFMTKLGLIFISHLTEKEIVKTTGNIIKIVPMLQNRGRMILEPKVTIITHMTWKKVKKIGTVKPEYEDKLVLLFKQTAELYVGDGTGLLPDELVLHTIPPGVQRTEEVVMEYAKKNYQLISSYFKDEQNRKEELGVSIDSATGRTVK
jgi:hypothetical protein